MINLKKLTHIAFAVKSSDEALPVFQNLLGATVLHGPFIPSDRQHRVLIPSVAGTIIELMEPTDDNGFLARFLAKRGEGFNHIGFDVEDIKGASKVLQSGGLHIVRERVDYPGLKYAFVHPKSFFGIELHLEEDWHSHSDLETV
jgi:methylmalonyl-CoA/ethylmalonyl-CoA epimerase